MFFAEPEVVTVERSTGTTGACGQGAGVDFATNLRAIAAMLTNPCRQLVTRSTKLSYFLWAAIIGADDGKTRWMAKRLEAVVTGKRADLEERAEEIIDPWIAAATDLAGRVPE